MLPWKLYDSNAHAVNGLFVMSWTIDSSKSGQVQNRDGLTCVTRRTLQLLGSRDEPIEGASWKKHEVACA